MREPAGQSWFREGHEKLTHKYTQWKKECCKKPPEIDIKQDNALQGKKPLTLRVTFSTTKKTSAT